MSYFDGISNNHKQSSSYSLVSSISRNKSRITYNTVHVIQWLESVAPIYFGPKKDLCRYQVHAQVCIYICVLMWLHVYICIYAYLSMCTIIYVLHMFQNSTFVEIIQPVVVDTPLEQTADNCQMDRSGSPALYSSVVTTVLCWMAAVLLYIVRDKY